jgi:predicted RNA-binding protein with PUA-like domain
MRESIDIRSTRVSQIDEVGRVARVIHTKSLSNYQATHVNREGKMRSDILFFYNHETEPELVSLMDITTFRHIVQYTLETGLFTKIYSSRQHKNFHFLSMIVYYENRRHPLSRNPE